MSLETELDIKRIQSLTDGAFSIAMTILILEVKIPTGLNSIELNDYFFEHTFQKLLIYILGFVTLGILWIGSHFHHHHVMKTDRTSSWLNIIFLMFVCIIPFSIGFLSDYKHDNLSIIFLGINLILSSLGNYLMLWYAWKKEYIKPHFTIEHFTHAKHRILFTVYIYMAIIVISYFVTSSFVLYLFLIPVILHVIPERGNKPIGQP
ncbi:DUF1211 domain-containing protein [Flaviaesturariibacter flavus]|uniref:DUF1211 domain-containing protein n=1 Tax=Flaviaesturariibacter flavus TaxID=2502780 RepID=A0A4R1B6A4_9BACT|nr:TMEM175 family protein [Flaviaesturariibacter flavus]TCJ12167.1 DUF1211 domain-containing protein [Flaviaesturariibacter flavus]